MPDWYCDYRILAWNSKVKEMVQQMADQASALQATSSAVWRPRHLKLRLQEVISVCNKKTCAGARHSAHMMDTNGAWGFVGKGFLSDTDNSDNPQIFWETLSRACVRHRWPLPAAKLRVLLLWRLMSRRSFYVWSSVGFTKCVSIFHQKLSASLSLVLPWPQAEKQLAMIQDCIRWRSWRSWSGKGGIVSI